MCVYYMTGTPEGSTESGFMEKPGLFVFVLVDSVALNTR